MKISADTLFELLDADEDASACADISEAACDTQPKSFTLQVLAQVSSKCADTLGSSRVVLPWLLSSIGSPAFFVAWLVPIRESLSLIPQLFIAASLRERPRRKGVYIAGAIVQGLCMLAMPAAVLLPTATLSAVAILLALAIFSTARALCSVSSKDVLGKTVAKGRRGRLSGLASSSAGVFTLAFAVFLFFYPGSAPLPVLIAMLLGASALWFVAALLFSRVPEQAGATEGGASGISAALGSMSLLKSDPDLRAFIIARILLISTAYAIPFLVVLVFDRAEGSTRALALIMLAEGLAALSSGALWGRFSDSASHRVMAASGLLTAATLGAVLLLPDALMSGTLGGLLGALLLYVAAVAHQGTRVGRKTYLVDLANADNRATYVAISNSVIGLFVLMGGALGWLAQSAGYESVMLVLAIMGSAGAMLSLKLKAV